MGGFGDFLDKAMADLFQTGSEAASAEGGLDPTTGQTSTAVPIQGTPSTPGGGGQTQVVKPGSQMFKAGQGTVQSTKAQSGASFAKLLRSGVSTASGIAAFLQKQPELRTPKPPPAGPSEAAAQAAERERRMRGRGGRASTILTSPLGVTAKPNVGVSTLLGL